jgi:hypothetical protein
LFNSIITEEKEGKGERDIIMPSELDLHYPPEACPFCGIAAAFPCNTSSTTTSTASTSSIQPISKEGDLMSCIPDEEASDSTKTSPSSFIILASEDVIAFLDILPMTRGHVLVATRGHRVKVEDLEGGEGRAVGEFSFLAVNWDSPDLVLRGWKGGG